MRLSDELTVIKGIGPKRAEPFKKVGITTIEELLAYFPRAYDQFEAPIPIAEVKEGQAVVSGTVAKDATVRRAGRMQLTETMIRDESGTLKGVWFHSPFLKNVLRAGDRRVFRGRVAVNRFGKTMEHPQFFGPQEYAALLGKLRPVYGLTTGLTSQMITGAIEAVLRDLPMLQEHLPEWIRREYRLAEYNYALQTIHFPTDWQELTFARHRLVFDEFFLFILAVRYLKDSNEVQE
ncbi:MAG: ATP-dependent DNA helicase RecG, partial [Lachnospiraceae bacterium]|nr:ATP-dependent DNA helicase RecG [Lachnospiraceae bacterium]